MEHRQREMEEQKRGKLQQLTRKNKDEQSEWQCEMFRCFQKDRGLALPLSHRLHFLERF